MADTKITALTALTAADPANDVIPIVDVSDTSMAASGTTKKISVNNILGASGTATLASATITGDLTAARLIVTGGTIPTNGLWLATTNTLEFAANSLAQYRIAPLGVFSWFDGAGGTRMTLNSTGLGVGTTPANDKILSLGSIGILLSGATSDFSFRNVGGTAIQRLRYTDSTGGLTIGSAIATAYPVELGGSTASRAIVIDSSINSIINVTSTAPTLATNNQMVFNLTSNTNLRISVRGTDGTTRTANITLA